MCAPESDSIFLWRDRTRAAAWLGRPATKFDDFTGDHRDRLLQRISGSLLTASLCDAALSASYPAARAVFNNGSVKDASMLLSLLSNKVVRPTIIGMGAFSGYIKDQQMLRLLAVVINQKNVATESLKENLLHFSVAVGNVTLLSLLLRSGSHANHQVFDSQRRSILGVAAAYGRLSTVEALIEAGANPNGMKLEQAGVASPLFAAIKGHHFDVVKYLLDAGAKANCRAQKSYDAVHGLALAISLGNLDAARLLLQHGADVNSSLNSRDSPLCSLVHLSHDEEGSVHFLDLLIQHGAMLNSTIIYSESDDAESDSFSDDESASSEFVNRLPSPSPRPMSALEMAAFGKDAAFLTALLDGGARPTSRAMLLAGLGKNLTYVRLLLDRSKQATGRLAYGHEMLRAAVMSDDLELVRALLEAKAPMYSHDQQDAASDSNESYCDNDFESDIEDPLAEAGYEQDGDEEEEPEDASPLQIAARKGHLEMVQLLLEQDASPFLYQHVRASDKTLALAIAAAAGRSNVADELLISGAKVPSSENVLAHAIQNIDQDSTILRLLSAGAQVNKLADACLLTPTPLQVAVATGKHVIVKALLDAGANIDAPRTFESSDTAICIAIAKRDWIVVDLLLGLGVDVNNPSSDGIGTKTALYHASVHGHLQLVQRLLHEGANPNDSMALAAAVMGDHPPIVQVLLAAYPPPRADLHFGCVALQNAIVQQDCELTRMLIDAQVAVNLPAAPLKDLCADKRQDHEFLHLTVLGAAILQDRSNDFLFVRMILDTGVDVQGCVDFAQRRNALQLAAQRDCPDLVRILLQAGADLNASPSFREDVCAMDLSYGIPIRIATRNGCRKTVSALLELGAVVDSKEEDSEGSLLFDAAKTGDLDLVRLLLDAGAVHNAHGPEYVCIALEAAVTRLDIGMVKVLLSAGSSAAGKSKFRFWSIVCHCTVGRAYSLLQILLEAGADSNSLGGVQRRLKQPDVEQKPFKYSCLPDWRVSAIQIATANTYIDYVALLIQFGADVNQQAVAQHPGVTSRAYERRYGLQPRSALEEAACLGHIDLLQLLLNAGAKTCGEGRRQYNRAVKLAASRCHYAAVRLLREHHEIEKLMD